MTAAYDAFIASAMPAPVTLVEVQPMEILQGWTGPVGIALNTYYCTWTSQIATAVTAGGIYRRLDEVRQNDIALTIQTSLNAVDANLGSYWFDTATNRLYVSTTTGASPDSFALLGAFFTLFFSTRDPQFIGYQFFHPIVTGNLPTAVEEMPDSLFGSLVSGTGTVTFLNGDKLFDKLSRQYVWRNKKVIFKFGGIGLDYPDYATIVTMRINRIVPDDDICILELETMSSILNRTLPIRTWGDFDQGRPVNDPAQGVSGIAQPIILGNIGAMPATFAGDDTWYVYDNSLVAPYDECQLNSVWAIDRVSKLSTQLAEGSDFSTSGDDSRIFILNPTYTHDTYDIVVSITQLGTLPNPFFGTMARALLEICGESTANIDTAAFTAADVAAPIYLARWLSEPRSAMDWMNELCQSVDGQVFVGSDGKWTCRLIRPDIPTTLVSLSDEDFVSWEPAEELASTLNEVRVRYFNQPYSDDWTEAAASNDTVRYANETRDSHRIDSWIVQSEPASGQANHALFFKSEPAIRIRTEERGLKLMGSHAGDLVNVKRQRAPVARTGTYDGHVLRIARIEKSPEPVITIELNDLDGRVDNIFRLAPSGYSTTFDSATAEEQAQLGFLADTNRYINTFKDLKTLW